MFGDLTDDAQDSIDRLAEEVGMVPNRIKPAYIAMASFAKKRQVWTQGMALALTERATLAAADSAAFYDKSIEEVTGTLQSFLKGKITKTTPLWASPQLKPPETQLRMNCTASRSSNYPKTKNS